MPQPALLTLSQALLNFCHFLSPIQIWPLAAFSFRAQRGLATLGTKMQQEGQIWIGPPFPGLWLLKYFLYICRETDDWISRFVEQTHYGPLLAWLTFGYTALIYHHLLASDLLSSFRTFADKLLIEFSSNLVGNLIMGLPQLINFGPALLNLSSVSLLTLM